MFADKRKRINSYVWIELGHFTAALEKETIAKLHYVGLVDTGHLFAAMLGGIIKGKLGNSVGLGCGDNLQAFNNPFD